MSHHMTMAGHGTDPPASPSPYNEEIQAQKPEGREHLRKLLNWEEFDELRDTRRSILLDTLYESIIFAVGKGFPWVGVAQVVKFTEELLKETKGCSITKAVTVLASKLQDYQGRFSTKHLQALCDYCHNTFIRHYRLYQYVLGQDQDVHLSVTHLEVCAPPQPLPLAQGVDIATWRHEQQVAELELAEAQRRARVLVLKEALQLEKEQQLHQRFSEAPQGRALRREEVESLVSEAIHVQVECLKEMLQHKIQATFDILDLNLQKKTITLGAPTPFPLCITSQPGQYEPLKMSKASKGKKGKARN